MRLGEQKLSEAKTVGEALLILQKFGFEASVLNDNLFHNSSNLVRLNNELLKQG